MCSYGRNYICKYEARSLKKWNLKKYEILSFVKIFAININTAQFGIGLLQKNILISKNICFETIQIGSKSKRLRQRSVINFLVAKKSKPREIH